MIEQELVMTFCADCGLPIDHDKLRCDECRDARDARWRLGGMEPDEATQFIREYLVDGMQSFNRVNRAARHAGVAMRGFTDQLMRIALDKYPEIESIETEHCVEQDALILRVKLHGHSYADALVFTPEFYE